MSSPISRRTVLRGAAALAGAGALAGCSSDGDAEGSKAKTTITYWDWYASQAGWVDNEIKLFQQANPGVLVKKTTQVSDKYADLVSLAYRSNNAPDILMVPKSPQLSQQVSQDWLMPVDKWATTSWQSRFPSGSFVEGVDVFDGKVYTAPFAAPAPSLQLYIHHGVFKDAGVTNADGSVKLPKTWDDVSAAADAIASKSGGKVSPFGFGNSTNTTLAWWLDLFVRGAGSPGGAAVGGIDGMDYRVGKWTFGTDRNYLDVINLLLEWKNKNWFYPNSMSISDEQARAFFERGRFGMTVGGVWNQPEWTKHKFTDYSLVTLPAPSGEPKALFYGPPGGKFVAVSSKTPHADEAWAWFDWLYSADAGKRWVEQGQGLSVYAKNNDPKGVTFAPFSQYVGLSGTAVVGPQPTIRNPKLTKLELPAVKPDINDVLAGVYTGQIKDAQGALTELTDKMNQALSTAVAKTGAGLKDFAFPDWDLTKPYTTKPGA
ncbi:extracellular solute-binding protein [Kribbella sp. NPDC051952]|uniref:ABC transporter substrate-binding protein n=1 Tax=Kribbella sp. NPDC051952 TaxID=3154851 RepID=UPI0034290D7F